MVQRRDSFTLLRERTRWRIALLMCLFGMGMMVVLGLLNARDGRQDSVFLSIAVFSVLAVCLVMLLALPRSTGGKIYFWITIGVLVYLPLFGLQQGRTFHYWAYVLPPVLFFLMRPKPALVAMIAFGIYACAMVAPFTPWIDVARIGLSYSLLVGFMYTYALLEESASAMLRYYSERDPLTNCLNRRTFNETLQEFEQAASDDGGAVLLMDVDRFKSINDVHGHLVGDRVITQVAATLGTELDTGMALYRYGGEEFAVMFAGGDEARALQLAERLRRAIETTTISGLQVTISIGVAVWGTKASSVAAALDAADNALYAAKRAGRNRVESASAHAPRLQRSL
ncbi:GGDEF domain-containing protein [Tahibacter amnicola]|uniref:diguanylate cyclase n=1 Tax=Tahibacter amnicola TaxID=2976241 RepID=A0ABY6BPU3_9GAMM|nr:GGDEF domain-containing protein [Tahibacter amnicola]UXI69792.1 GGDEF domain-containing protein [Tahibacter amnicola]